MYSDALLLAAALAAFVLLEHHRPALAGLAAAVAMATRPTGVAVAIALVIRALEARRVLTTGPPRLWGYGLYVAIAVALPAVTSREFLAMGRYTLVAFPAIAVLAQRLSSPKWRPLLLPSLALAAVGLAAMASFWARWYLLT